MSTLEINVACAVEGVPEAVYHADPVQGGSLSYTGMKELLKSPAHYRHYMDTPRESKPAFDEGHIIHSLVLGTELNVVELPYESFRSKASQMDRDKARADGLIPLKQGELDPLKAVAEAVLNDATARPLFEYDGPTELSMFAPDSASGVWLRGRADKVSVLEGETVLVDLKTTRDADPRQFSRAVADFGYYIQGALYGDLYQQTHDQNQPAPEMVFVAVTKTEPHLVSVSRLDWQYEHLAVDKIQEAISLYKKCTATGEWPGYDGVHLLEPPSWLIYQDEEEIEITQ